jgi:hypothetical protein
MTQSAYKLAKTRLEQALESIVAYLNNKAFINWDWQPEVTRFFFRFFKDKAIENGDSGKELLIAPNNQMPPHRSKEPYFYDTVGLRDLYDVRVSFINGIDHTPQEVINIAKKISNAHNNIKVHCCLNETKGLYQDVKYVLYHKRWGGEAKIVNALVDHFKRLLKEVGKHGHIVHYAHSYGALITYLAAARLTPEEKAQIEVITLGPVQLIKTEETGYRKALNYFSEQDHAMLWMNPEARRLAWKDTDKENKEIIILAPHPSAPHRIDHSLEGPTYTMVWKECGERFIQTHDRLWGRVKQNIYTLFFKH